MPFSRRGGIAADKSVATARVNRRRHFRVYAVSTAPAAEVTARRNTAAEVTAAEATRRDPAGENGSGFSGGTAFRLRDRDDAGRAGQSVGIAASGVLAWAGMSSASRAAATAEAAQITNSNW